MDTIHIAAALLSALLHAGWNAVVKASPDPKGAMTAQMVAGAVLALPLLAWSGLPAAAAWPWIAASTALNLATVLALLRAYELAGFGFAYPVVRAVSVLLVVALAASFSGEWPSPAGLAGIGLVALALLLLAGEAAGKSAVPGAALLWIGVAGVATAAYVLCDAQGVRRAGSALAYGFAVSIANALVMSAHQSRAAPPWRSLAASAWRAVPIAVASLASYLLILWVWSLAPIAPAAALRDTSALFAILIAVWWLREDMTGLKLLAVALAAVAVPLLRFA